MPRAGCDGSLDRVRRHDVAARLPREQVDGVRGVMPEQVVGPRARLAQRIHVRATEEVGLHVHLLDAELAGPDLPVHPLVARIEPARVPHHRDLAGRLLQPRHRLRVLQGVGERDLDLDVLARLEAGDRLCGVHLRRRAEDDRVDFLQREAVGEVGGHVADAVPGRDLLRLVELAPHDRDDLDAVDQPDRVEVLGAEGSGAGQRDFDRTAHRGFSRIRWPTAVLEAGTW